MKFKTYDEKGEIELKDCPFCGGEPIVIHIGNDRSKKERTIEIKCSKCYVKSINSVLIHNFSWIEKLAAKDWNERTGRPKLEELKQEYAIQDNRGTTYPTYVTVQELVCIGVMAEGHSERCPYGDGETRIEHDCDMCSQFPCWDEKTGEIEPEHCDQEVRCGYIWHPVEFFLTIKGAEEYMKTNAHNHGKLRTYVDHFHRRNFEMRELLSEIGFKTNDN